MKSESRTLCYPPGMMSWQKDEFAISTDPARIDLKRVHAFLSQAYWCAGIPIEVVKKSIDGSLPFGIYRGGEQIGFARVITDYATIAYLGDVYVEPEWRGRGLSKWLMECILAHPELQGLRRFCLLTKDAQGLYAKFGFKNRENPTHYMEVLVKDLYRKS